MSTMVGWTVVPFGEKKEQLGLGMGLIFWGWVGLGQEKLDPYLGRPNPWVQTHFLGGSGPMGLSITMRIITVKNMKLPYFTWYS